MPGMVLPDRPSDGFDLDLQIFPQRFVFGMKEDLQESSEAELRCSGIGVERSGYGCRRAEMSTLVSGFT
jgi:hypothetical protein